MIKIFRHALRRARLNRVVDRRKDKSCLDLYYNSKHIKGTINHQFQKLTPLGLVFYVAVIYFGPRGEREQRRGSNALWAFLVLSVKRNST